MHTNDPKLISTANIVKGFVNPSVEGENNSGNNVGGGTSSPIVKRRFSLQEGEDDAPMGEKEKNEGDNAGREIAEEMRERRFSWSPDTEKELTVQTTLPALKDDLNYEEAKRGDDEAQAVRAAARLVKKVTKVDRVMALKQRHPNAIVLPVLPPKGFEFLFFAESGILLRSIFQGFCQQNRQSC